MKIYFNPLDKRCKSQTGAIPRGSAIEITVFSDETDAECFLLYRKDGESETKITMNAESYGWHSTMHFDETGLYFYRFMIGGRFVCPGTDRNAVFCEPSGGCYQLTVYREDFETPQWFKGGILYQIFPDRFAKEGTYPISGDKILREDWGGTPVFLPDERGIVRNNDFFGGNLKGICSKLDYLRSLHVSAVYLNPIFESASNHRYDTGNYLKIDSLLGTEADLDELMKEGKRRGIRFILDGVFNHTGDDSVYFNRYGRYNSLGAAQSSDSPYNDWYNFSSFPNEYECWWGIRTLPAVNERSASYQNFIFGDDGVLKTWLRHGIGGYRLDVADELPDFFLKKLRDSVKAEKKDALIIGEVWEDASNKIAYGERRRYFQGEELDSVMNYPLKNAIIDYMLCGKTKALCETINMLVDHYPKCVLDCLMNSLSTHDTARILTVLGEKNVSSKEEMATTFLSADEKGRAVEKLKMATVLQYTMPGVPCVYYGDENGAEGYSDPFCRRCFDWAHLNEELIDFYRKIGEIRTRLKDVFSEGEYTEVYRDERMLLYARTTGEKSCYIFVNNSSYSMNFSLNGTFKELLSETVFRSYLFVKPFSYGILSKI